MNIEDIINIWEAHQKQPKQPKDAVRFFDGKTPYFTHPLWCATSIAVETSLDEKTREEGSLVLLYHDVREDTTKNLPDYLSERVKYLISEMTFYGGMQEEMNEIWNKSKEVRLYKLYDKVNNLMSGSWMSPSKRKIYEEYTKKLLEDVERNYGNLNITKIARAIIK